LFNGTNGMLTLTSFLGVAWIWILMF
jgi:hypothetical protein